MKESGLEEEEWYEDGAKEDENRLGHEAKGGDGKHDASGGFDEAPDDPVLDDTAGCRADSWEQGSVARTALKSASSCLLLSRLIGVGELGGAVDDEVRKSLAAEDRRAGLRSL